MTSLVNYHTHVKKEIKSYTYSFWKQMIIPNSFPKPNITLTSKQGNDITRKWKINILYEHGCKNLHQNTSKWLTNVWKDAWQRPLLEKCKSKLQWDITSYQSEWPSSKSLQTINAGEGVEKREHSCTVGGNVNWYSHYGRRYGDSLKS